MRDGLPILREGMHRGPGLSEVHPIELDPLNAKRVPITCRHPFSSVSCVLSATDPDKEHTRGST